MNDQERVELEQLKERQLRLAEEVTLLSAQVSRLEQKLNQPVPETPKVDARTSVRDTEPIRVALKPEIPQPSPTPLPSVPIPPILPFEPATRVPPVLPEPAPAQKASFEMRLGTYWAPRIGIVAVLTGLVFFGNLAYQKYISQLGPGGKVLLLYLASVVLLGAGAWWQRKAAKESLKNYAQVLLAGGLAAVYFTTYAAYHVDRLRIIQSPALDGGLLLAWAGFMVWVADRKKSELLALFAIGLAYYTSIITHVGLFTLYSNLILTIAAVGFLVRNRWAALSFASLIATYAAYAFWRFFDGSAWHWASPAEGLWMGTYFLMCYWSVFTLAVFLSKHKEFAGENRAGFLTANNAAFFASFVLTMVQVNTGGFWIFSLTYGAVLLALACLARFVFRAEPLCGNSYLVQGLLLVTIGIISKFTGLQLALILAAESVALLWLGQQFKNSILLAGAWLAAALAVGWGMDGMREFDRTGLWLGMALGALMLVNALLAHRHAAPVAAGSLRPQPGYFTLLALLIWLVATWDNTSRAQFPLVLAAEALLLTFSFYLLRVGEISLFAQGYLLLSQLAWVFNAFDGGQTPPWWNPVLMIAITLGISHWLQKQKTLGLRPETGLFWQGFYALAIIGLLCGWLAPKTDMSGWLALTGLLAIGVTAYGVLTRAWLLAICGQILLVISCTQFVLQLSQTAGPRWYFPLAPVAALGLLSFSTVKWFEHKPDANGRISPPLLQVALVYRWVALAMSIWWVCQYFPARERIWLFAALGGWGFIWAGWQRSSEALLYSSALTLAGLVLFWLPLFNAPKVYWPNLLAILLLLVQQRFAKRYPERYGLNPILHAVMIILGGLSLWLFLSWCVLEKASGFYLTASWSVLALVLLPVGIILRERAYRWLGLGVLTGALGRILFLDLWKLGTIYRVLSLIALGVVLLVLGFIYNKYQDKMKEWL